MQRDNDKKPANEQIETSTETNSIDTYKHNQHVQFHNARLQAAKTDWPIFPYANGKMMKCFCGWKPLTWSRLLTRQCVTRSSWLTIPRVQFIMQRDKANEEEVMDARLCMKCSIECIACKGVFLLRDSLKYGLCVRCNCK